MKETVEKKCVQARCDWLLQHANGRPLFMGDLESWSHRKWLLLLELWVRCLEADPSLRTDVPLNELAAALNMHANDATRAWIIESIKEFAQIECRGRLADVCPDALGPREGGLLRDYRPLIVIEDEAWDEGHSTDGPPDYVSFGMFLWPALQDDDAFPAGDA